MIFTFEIVKQENYCLINLNGELLESSQGNLLLEELEKKLSEGNLNFIVDFSKLNFLNSCGLGILVRMLTKIRNKSGEIVGFGLNEKVNKLLIITKLNQLFTIKEDLLSSTKAIIFK
jgi:anti-sigma B factor antagonist